MSFLEDRTDHELILLKSALLAYKECPHCSHEYPRTHSSVTRYILPKIKRATSRRFEELTNLDQQIQFLFNETETI